MIVVTTHEVPGKEIIACQGLVRGGSVRAVPINEDVTARMKNMIGGEVEEYTQVLAQAREQAIDRMIAQAKELGGNAIVGFKFVTAEVMAGAAELVAYGTAVTVQ